MTAAVSTKVIAGCFGLAAFAVAIIAGLASDNPAAQILLHAVIATLVCYPIGWIAGLICQRVIGLHLEARIKSQQQVASNSSATPIPTPAESEDAIIV